MQMEMRQLDVDDVPGRGVQLLAPRRVERPFGFFHQPVITLVVPAREELGEVALGVEVALEKAIRVEAVGVASYETVKIALLEGSEEGHRIEGLQSHLKTAGVPHLLDYLRRLTIVGHVRGAFVFDRGAHRTRLPEQGRVPPA